MSHLIVKAKKTYLKSPLSAGATSVVLRSLKDSKDNNINMSSFGDFGVLVIKQGETIEMIKFTNVSYSSDDTATVSVATNGRNLNPTSPYAGFSTGKSFQSGAEVIITNDPLTVMQFGNLNNENTWAELQTFTKAPVSNADAISTNELVRFSQLQDAILGEITLSSVICSGVGGEVLGVDTLVYQDDTNGKWYKTDADTNTKVENVKLGITRGTCAGDGSNITNGITLMGLHEASSSLYTANTKYFASNTAGEVSTSAGTFEVSVGLAISTTRILFYPRFDQMITQKQKDILSLITEGQAFYEESSNASDTYEISLNPAILSYVDGLKIRFKTDVANTGVASLNVNGLGAVPIKKNFNQDLETGDIKANQIVEVVYNSTGNIFQMNSHSALSKSQETYTASGDINQNDIVYVASANTVASNSLLVSMDTGASVGTAPSSLQAPKSFPLSTNGMYIRFSGGNIDYAQPLYAQVRTINAGETDFSNGSQATIYSTGAGCRNFSVAQIGTDKFIVAFQSDTAGSPVGIKFAVITVSGTTITVGSIVTIDTGIVNYPLSISKLNTDKAIVFYRQDGTDDLACQVLTISGTTISTNTPVIVKASNGVWHISSAYLSTDKAIVVYRSNTTGILYGKIVNVSGTTPTPDTEQTIINTSAIYVFDVFAVNSTKVILIYSESTTPVNDQISILTISGATIVKSTNLALASARINKEFGCYVISDKCVLTLDFGSTTSLECKLINIEGSAPTLIATQNLSSSAVTTIQNTSVVRVSPFVYVVEGSAVNDNDYIVKLRPNLGFIGIAKANILNGATGDISYRFQTLELSGITLVAGSIYYLNDNGQITNNKSLISPAIGVAISTTKILLT